MHIVLLILKIVGIILLAVLGLVLCLLLAVLFVPLRYRLKAVREPQNGFAAEFHISWLLHLLRVNGIFDGNKFAVSVRLAMFTLMKTGADEPDNEKEKQKENKTETNLIGQESAENAWKETADVSEKKKMEETADIFSEEGRKAAADHKTHAKAVKDIKASGTSQVPGKTSGARKKTKADVQVKRNTFIKKWSERIQNAFLLVCSLPQKTADLLTQVLALLSGLPDSQNGIAERIERLQKTIRPYLTTQMKNLYSGLLGRLKKLLQHYKPRKMEGYIQFGTGMADMTGMLTGVLYLLLPANACQYEIDPVFNEAVFNTDTAANGHIRFCHAAVFGIKCLLDKDFRRLLRLIRRGREE